MAVYVNTNYSALQGQRYLGNVQNSLTTTYQRLSSGMRINSAKDDAAGLQIADRLTSQINGLNQGNRNASDGIALAQTMEAGMDEISGMLQKVRTLAVQANNGTNTSDDRRAIGKEMEALVNEVNRIAQKTTFAGATVLDGGKAPNNLMREIKNAGGQGTGKYEYFFQVGANAKDEISLECGAFTIQGVLSMVNAPLGQADKLKVADTEADAAVAGKSGLALSAGTAKASTAYWVVSDPVAAQNTLANIDKFIEMVDSKRAALGAIQNRMESTIRNQSSISENESDARSRIRDTDFASETAALTQNQIIQQASQTILSQANQRPTVALNLLGGR